MSDENDTILQNDESRNEDEIVKKLTLSQKITNMLGFPQQRKYVTIECNGEPERIRHAAPRVYGPAIVFNEKKPQEQETSVPDTTDMNTDKGDQNE